MRPILLLAACLAAGHAVADDAPPSAAVAEPRRDEARIGGHAGGSAQGVVSVNVAAGSLNAQANVRAIAFGDAGAGASGVQRVDAGAADRRRDATAHLGGGAFHGTQGIVGLNQAAGSANAQLNVLALAASAGVDVLQQVDNLVLAGVAAPTESAGDPAAGTARAPLREAHIDGGAFGAPSGVVQINQTAGVGNASANAIVLHLPGGTR
jgi:hypothetical protein